MKNVLNLTCFLILIFTNVLFSAPSITISNEEVKIPNHVKYIKAKDVKNKKAIEAIQNLCSDKEYQSSEVPDVIMVGPRLWNTVKGLKPISDEPTMKAHLKVPINGEIKDIEAGVIRFKERTYNFLYAFKKIVNKSKNVLIRKANENELSYYWMMIAFDIDEPLFVIELDNCDKYLIHFDDKFEFFYIEEVNFDNCKK